jgi:hypothetical protein
MKCAICLMNWAAHGEICCLCMAAIYPDGQPDRSLYPVSQNHLDMESARLTPL